MTHSLRVRMRRWHRSAGALAAIGVLLLVVTGMLLNHAPSLGLDRSPVRSEWVLSRYGIEVEAPTSGYFVEPLWLSVCGGRLYVDTEAVSELDRITGAVRFDGMLFVGGGDGLLVLDGQGVLIDRLDRASLPGAVSALAVQGARLLLEAGGRWYASDSNLLRWTPSAAPAMTPQLRQLPEQIATVVGTDARGRQLDWERVLLDVHSGRLFGGWGPWLVDLFALTMALLAISGFWLWLRSRHRPHN